MSETYAPDGFSGGTPTVKRGLTVEEIVRKANNAGIDPRMVTRVCFFLLREPEVARAFGLGGQK